MAVDEPENITYEENECFLTGGGSLHGMVPEAHTDEDCGKDGETHELIISIEAGAIERRALPGSASFPNCQ